MNREDLKDKTVSFQYISEESMVKQQTLFIFLSFMLSQDQEMIILRLQNCSLHVKKRSGIIIHRLK